MLAERTCHTPVRFYCLVREILTDTVSMVDWFE